MKLGLIRHFKVDLKPQRTWLTGEQFNQWVQEYELAPIQAPEHEIGGQRWTLCLCSDQERAVLTASYFEARKFVYTELLREISVTAPRLKTIRLSGLRLPVNLWLVLGRLFWSVGHSSQAESKAAVLRRADKVIDSLLIDDEASAQEGCVLIVSHGAFMKILDRRLRRRGYEAERMRYPRNGQIFMYEMK
ncbi:histidine phosphatase family protein [Paenibacillus sp. FSL R7-0204]|uniref:histidine phosphatase family protein n=1 Tax=Paenibacillus sp. FSL R7-0204 TaxID=2921675 RepID=UPI0030F6B703